MHRSSLEAAFLRGPAGQPLSNNLLHDSLHDTHDIYLVSQALVTISPFPSYFLFFIICLQATDKRDPVCHIFLKVSKGAI